MTDERLLQDMLKMIESVLKMLEKAGKTDSIEHRLAQVVFDDITNGSKPFMVTIDYPQCEQAKELLKQAGVPFVTMATSMNANSPLAFVTSEKHMIEFQSIMEEFEHCNPAEAKCKAPYEIMVSAYNLKYKEMPVLDFENKNAARVIAQKAYQSDIQCAIRKNKDTGHMEIYLNPTSNYSCDPKKGDFNKFKLNLAIENLKTSDIFGEKSQILVDTRLAQAEYDRNVVKEFTSRLLNGEKVTLKDSKDNKNEKLQFECENRKFYEIKDGKKEVIFDFNDPRVDSHQIEDFLSTYVEKINNMQILDGKGALIIKEKRPSLPIELVKEKQILDAVEKYADYVYEISTREIAKDHPGNYIGDGDKIKDLMQLKENKITRYLKDETHQEKFINRMAPILSKYNISNDEIKKVLNVYVDAYDNSKIGEKSNIFSYEKKNKPLTKESLATEKEKYCADKLATLQEDKENNKGNDKENSLD